jgi:hypothetical protein
MFETNGLPEEWSIFRSRLLVNSPTILLQPGRTYYYVMINVTILLFITLIPIHTFCFTMFSGRKLFPAWIISRQRMFSKLASTFPVVKSAVPQRAGVMARSSGIKSLLMRSVLLGQVCRATSGSVGRTLSTLTTKHSSSPSEIVKRALDTRDYKAITLANGMRVLLISDPLSNRSAAALDVHIGYFSDPRNLPGLAHFCEHMSFLGTQKYPGEEEFSSFLSTNGGSSNAYTDSEDTVYVRCFLFLFYFVELESYMNNPPAYLLILKLKFSFLMLMLSTSDLLSIASASSSRPLCSRSPPLLAS